MDNDFKYDDIINLPHHKSATRKPMDRLNRAAQFSSFAAVTGHDSAVDEKARLTERKIELDEYERQEIDFKLNMINSGMDDLEFSVTYFIPDDKKDGGRYSVKTSHSCSIKEYERILILDDGTEISIDNIYNIDISTI